VRRSNGIAAAVLSIAVAVPATAPAAVPVPGRFVNRDQAKGLFLNTTRHTVKTLWLFCRRPDYDRDPSHTEFRAARFEVPDLLHVGRGGRFSFHGKGNRYGPEGQPLGKWKIRLTGRFVTRKRVRIKRTLQGCGTRVVGAKLKRRA
jgi:hypothetical protein